MHDFRFTPLHLGLLLAAALALGTTLLGFEGLRPERVAMASPAVGAPPTASVVRHSGVLVADAAPPVVDTAPLPLAASPGVPSAPAVPAAPVTDAAPPTTVVERRGGVACATPHRVASVSVDTVVRAAPGGRAIGTLPAQSAYMGQSTVAWVQRVSADGRWGLVTVPWGRPVRRAGWIALDGVSMGSTRTMVVADLSERRLRVLRGCDDVLSVPIAIGGPQSPSPTGRFWVSDRVSVPGAQRSSFGSYAFGLSTIQPNTPPGWTGGDQMAIHGTGDPGSIGLAASAGCLRVSEATLASLRPLLRPGTPVVITA